MWDKAKIQALLDTKPAAVTRAVLAIYALQTSQERNAQTTQDANNVGFSAYDAPFLSDIAEKIKKGYTLSPKQFEVTKNKIRRYHRQLADIANVNEAKAVSAAVVPEGEFKRLLPACRCEDFDGERTCDWCLDPENAEIRMLAQEIEDGQEMQRRERSEVARVAAFKMRRDQANAPVEHW